jgi:Rrf2 family protein
MRFSKAAVCGVYGMRYLALLSSGRGNVRIHLGDIAEKTGLSEPNLARIFQHLIRSGLLRSARGSGGGFRLGRDVSRISLLDIIEAIEGPTLNDGCLLTLGTCEIGDDCTVGSTLREAEEAMHRVLRKTTLADLTKPCVQCPKLS